MAFLVSIHHNIHHVPEGLGVFPVFQYLLLIHLCIVLVPALLLIWVPVLRVEFVRLLVVCLLVVRLLVVCLSH